MFLSVSFNFNVIVNFPDFLLLWISSFIILWSETIFDKVHIFFVQTCTWPNIISVLENVIYVLERNVYSSAIRWNVVICLLCTFGI